MGLCSAVLMCHAPIVVPAVGGARGAECAATTAGMRAAARRLLAGEPEVLIVVSPHTPRARDAFGVVEADRVSGNLAAFRAPDAAFSLPGAPGARTALHAAARRAGVRTAHLAPQVLDHGASVPLWFAAEAGWRGETAVVALPWDPLDEVAFGRVLAAALADRRWALLASGDLSHRRIPGAPAGYDPRAASFDDAFVGALRRSDLATACDPDPDLRERAAEDVVASARIALGAVGSGHPVEVLAYEGPFGVGYCEAVLFEEAA